MFVSQFVRKRVTINGRIQQIFHYCWHNPMCRPLDAGKRVDLRHRSRPGTDTSVDAGRPARIYLADLCCALLGGANTWAIHAR
jgi:hypothetical protein